MSSETILARISIQTKKMRTKKSLNGKVRCLLNLKSSKTKIWRMSISKKAKRLSFMRTSSTIKMRKKSMERG